MSEVRKKFKATVIVQARMSSTRLPEKAALDMGGAPMLARLLERLSKLPAAYRRVVATSTEKHDNFIADTASEAGWHTVRGPLDDVLGRYALALGQFPSPFAVRVTGDNPFTDPKALVAMVELAATRQADYVHAPEMPIGTAAEVFSAACLTHCTDAATTPFAREHINAYIYDNRDQFNICNYRLDTLENKNSYLRLTVDTEEDFAFANQLYSALHGNMAASLATVISTAENLAHE